MKKRNHPKMNLPKINSTNKYLFEDNNYLNQPNVYCKIKGEYYGRSKKTASRVAASKLQIRWISYISEIHSDIHQLDSFSMKTVTEI